MRILVLSQWYAPEPMRFLPEMAESLGKLGHEVEILTGFPNWPAGRIYPGYRLRLRQVETLDGVRVVRAPLYPNHGRSAFGRAANLLSFSMAAALVGAISMRRPDIIHAVQPPTACLPAWMLSRLWRVPYSYEVQDMWPETLVSTGFVGNRRVLATVGAYCRWCYRTAAALRVISPGFRDHLIARGVDPAKIALIPNWVDTGFYGEPAGAGEGPELPEGFRVLYAGTIGLAQGLGAVLDAAGHLADTDVRFVVAGDGLELQQLRDAARMAGLTNVTFLGRQPMSLMPWLYARADAFLVSLKKDPLFAMTIPHKTQTYMAAAKPIIAAAEGDVASLVASTGCGLVAAPADGADLANRVRELRELSPAERAAMGQRGRSAALRLFARETLVGQLADMFEGMRHPEARAGGAAGSAPRTHGQSEPV